MKLYDSTQFDFKKKEYEFKRLQNQFRVNENNYKIIFDRYLLNKKSFLDIGCGYGFLARMIEEKYGVIYSGLDICEDYINKARTLYPGSNFFVCDMNEINIESIGKYDVIFASFVFQHLGDGIDNFLLKIKQLLKDDGLLIIYDIDKLRNIFIPTIDNVNILYKLEYAIGKLASNNIYIMKSIESILLRNSYELIDYIDVPTSSENTNKNFLIDMVNYWMEENNKSHPVIRTGKLTLDDLNNVFNEFRKHISTETYTFSIYNGCAISRRKKYED